MKRFKIGIVAVVAVIAMSFTVATSTTSLKGKLDTDLGCFTNVPVASAVCLERSLPTSGLHHEVLSDPICIGYASTPSFTGIVSNPNSLAEYPNGCPEGNDVLCCYKIIEKTSGSFCCPTASKSYEVTEVFFRGN